jgi:hypothetical protein
MKYGHREVRLSTLKPGARRSAVSSVCGAVSSVLVQLTNSIAAQELPLHRGVAQLFRAMQQREDDPALDEAVRWDAHTPRSMRNFTQRYLYKMHVELTGMSAFLDAQAGDQAAQPGRGRRGKS